MNRPWTAALLLALAAVPAGASHVESLYRIPPRRASETAGGPSRALAISADGRYTVVASEAANLVPGMAAAPFGVHLFLYDRVDGTFVRISRTAIAGPPLSTSLKASISADGRFVAFHSRAADEVEGQSDANHPELDIFLWDRDTGETKLVSRSDADPLRTGNGSSNNAAVSADGRFVAFTSDATDLVEGFSATSSNVFLWDRQTDEIEPVSRSAGAPDRLANADSFLPSISADGRFVAFLSLASDLVAGQVDRTNRGTLDVFLWDRATRQTVLVSRSAANPLATANQASLEALVSANGRFVAFISFATDLFPGQQAGRRKANLFLWDRETGRTFLVSRGPQGIPARGFGMNLAAITPSGSHVLFSSDAKELLTNPDTSSRPLNVFLWSRATGKVTLVSRSTTRGRGGNFHSSATGLSADGAWIVFDSAATNLNVAGGAARDIGIHVFLANSRSGRIDLLSDPDPSAAPTPDAVSAGSLISADGRWIAFTSNAADLEGDVRDSNSATDVVLATRGGDRTIVTVHPPGLASATPLTGNGFATSIDASGRFVVFVSNADVALLVPGVQELEPNDSGFDVFLYDRELRTLTLVTRSGTDPRFTADGSSREARISADGRWVTFTSEARDLLPDVISGTGLSHVFLWDRTTGQTILVSRAAGSPTTGGDDFSSDPRISADGSAVVFESYASDLVAGQTDDHDSTDVFLFDRTTGTVSLVSRAAGSETVSAGRHSFRPMLSADGRIVAFTSTANAANLVPGVTGASLESEAFLFDRVTGAMTLASRTTAPVPTAGGGHGLALSGDGRFLVLASLAPDLVPGQTDGPGTSDLFLFDRIAGTTILVTHTAASLTTAAAAGVSLADISADGRFTAFASTAANLVPGQVDVAAGASNDIFVFDRQTGAIEMISRAAGTVATGGSGESIIPRISADGRRVAFFSDRLDLSPGLHGSGPSFNLYVHDRPSGTTTLVTYVSGDPAQLSSAGAPPGSLLVTGPFLSANGTVVAFTSPAPGLVPRDFNRLPDAFAATVP